MARRNRPLRLPQQRGNLAALRQRTDPLPPRCEIEVDGDQWALWLDAQHRLLAAEELFRGTLSQTSVYPREVVKKALAHNAAAVVFAHNHPSGVAEPSPADEALTRSLKQSLALVDVRVLDHFVVAGPSQPLSFAERGLL